MCLKASPAGPACCSRRTSAASPDRWASTRSSTCACHGAPCYGTKMHPRHVRLVRSAGRADRAGLTTVHA